MRKLPATTPSTPGEWLDYLLGVLVYRAFDRWFSRERKRLIEETAAAVASRLEIGLPRTVSEDEICRLILKRKVSGSTFRRWRAEEGFPRPLMGGGAYDTEEVVAWVLSRHKARSGSLAT